MSEDAVIVENLTKEYQLGVLGRNTLRNSWRHLFRASSSQTKHTEADQRFLALDDVSFIVKKGDAVGVIGRNGAGKSTLLKILSGITTPTSGKITIKGRAASLLEIGTGFHPEMTGRENVYLNGAILGMKKDEIDAKFPDIIEFSDIGRFIDTPVKRYSSGMYVRLAFSVAANLDPEILIVDEVLAVGDLNFQQKCLAKMEGSIRANGRTVLFVSHNLSAISKLCRKSILLENGRLVAAGPTEEIIAAYTGTPYVQKDLEVSWPNESDAPQNDRLLVKRLYITDQDANLLACPSCDEDFLVNIEFDLKKPSENVFFILKLHTKTGELGFTSIGNLETAWVDAVQPIGSYRSICRIPKCLLNYGEFYLGLSIPPSGGKPSGKEEFPKLLEFRVADGTAVRGNYTGELNGIFRPMLSWKTVPIANRPEG